MLLEKPTDCVIAIHYIAGILQSNQLKDISIELRFLADKLDSILSEGNRKNIRKAQK